MKRKRNDFDTEEEFEHNQIPTDFTPVTPDDMYTLRKKYLEEIDNDFSGKYTPSAAKQILGAAISGEYDNMKAIIEGAYNGRRQRMHLAFREAIRDADERLELLKKTFKDHEDALVNYIDLHRELSGSTISLDLCVDTKKIKEISDEIMELKKQERNRNEK